MKNITAKAMLIAALFLTGAFFTADRAQAQMVLVESRYRIVKVDPAENRIGVALEDANPNKVQTWVRVDIDTRGSVREYIRRTRSFRDRQLGPKSILNVAAQNRGDLIKVKGGRGWDGNITAKTVWM